MGKIHKIVNISDLTALQQKNISDTQLSAKDTEYPITIDDAIYVNNFGKDNKGIKLSDEIPNFPIEYMPYYAIIKNIQGQPNLDNLYRNAENVIGNDWFISDGRSYTLLNEERNNSSLITTRLEPYGFIKLPENKEILRIQIIDGIIVENNTSTEPANSMSTGDTREWAYLTIKAYYIDGTEYTTYHEHVHFDPITYLGGEDLNKYVTVNCSQYLGYYNAEPIQLFLNGQTPYIISIENALVVQEDGAYYESNIITTENGIREWVYLKIRRTYKVYEVETDKQKNPYVEFDVWKKYNAVEKPEGYDDTKNIIVKAGDLYDHTREGDYIYYDDENSINKTAIHDKLPVFYKLAKDTGLDDITGAIAGYYPYSIQNSEGLRQLIYDNYTKKYVSINATYESYHNSSFVSEKGIVKDKSGNKYASLDNNTGLEMASIYGSELLDGTDSTWSVIGKPNPSIGVTGVGIYFNENYYISEYSNERSETLLNINKNMPTVKPWNNTSDFAELTDTSTKMEYPFLDHLNHSLTDDEAEYIGKNTTTTINKNHLYLQNYRLTSVDSKYIHYGINYFNKENDNTYSWTTKEYMDVIEDASRYDSNHNKVSIPNKVSPVAIFSFNDNIYLITRGRYAYNTCIFKLSKDTVKNLGDLILTNLKSYNCNNYNYNENNEQDVSLYFSDDALKNYYDGLFNIQRTEYIPINNIGNSTNFFTDSLEDADVKIYSWIIDNNGEYKKVITALNHTSLSSFYFNWPIKFIETISENGEIIKRNCFIFATHYNYGGYKPQGARIAKIYLENNKLVIEQSFIALDYILKNNKDPLTYFNAYISNVLVIKDQESDRNIIYVKVSVNDTDEKIIFYSYDAIKWDLLSVSKKITGGILYNQGNIFLLNKDDNETYIYNKNKIKNNRNKGDFEICKSETYTYDKELQIYIHENYNKNKDLRSIMLEINTKEPYETFINNSAPGLDNIHPLIADSFYKFVNIKQQNTNDLIGQCWITYIDNTNQYNTIMLNTYFIEQQLNRKYSRVQSSIFHDTKLHFNENDVCNDRRPLGKFLIRKKDNDKGNYTIQITIYKSTYSIDENGIKIYEINENNIETREIHNLTSDINYVSLEDTDSEKDFISYQSIIQSLEKDWIIDIIITRTS